MKVIIITIIQKLILTRFIIPLVEPNYVFTFVESQRDDDAFSCCLATKPHNPTIRGGNKTYTIIDAPGSTTIWGTPL
jgi:hypothetical protein